MITRMLRPLQITARRFLKFSGEMLYVGEHSCLHNAAASVTWNEVEGDYLEFGVFRGESFVTAYRTIHNERRRRDTFLNSSRVGRQQEHQNRVRFFAFDSFLGLPEGPAARQEDYAPKAYTCSQEKFTQNIVKLGVDLKDVVLVSGFYEQSLTSQKKEEHGLRHASVVMIDCDLYESTVPVLNFLTDLVSQGTIIIFHDWFRFRGSPKCGEQRACGEWLERNPQLELVEFWREGPQSVAFLVNLR
jgi:O-methyltransferase